jgi:hypothetical protein
MMDKKQLASLQRHAERFTARHGYGDKPLPLYIRVAESKIYHGKPMHKALLKEVIYMRMTDLHENDTRIPNGTPWSKDYRLYEGWTYASQKYLANRVGSKDSSYVAEVLREIEEDGFLESRSYPIRNKGFQRRKQYFALDEAIGAKIAELGVIEDEDESADKSDDKSDGSSHKGLTTVVSRVKPQPPVGLNLSATVVKPHSPEGLNHKELGSSVGLSEGVGLVRSLRTPPSGIVKSVTPSHQEQNNPNPAQAQGSQAKTKATPTPKTKAAAAPRRGIVGFDGEPVGMGFEEEPAGFDERQAGNGSIALK